MRTNNWAIQLSRSIYDSDIWHKPSDWLKIWIYILWNVNYWNTNQFKRWENYFKYELIALECDTTYKVVVNCVKFLKEGKQIETHKTTRGNIIKVINYDKYQDLTNYGKADRKADGKASRHTIKEERKESKEYIVDYKNFVESEKNISTVILKVFLDLWYKPNEPLDKFREWVKTRIADKHKFSNLWQLEYIMNNFYDYWIEQPKSKKRVWKTTLINNFELKEFKK